MKGSLLRMLLALIFYISPLQIEQHWKQFKRFDTNGDQSLDMTEMMSGLTSSIGHHFTPAQVRVSFGI